MLFDLPFKTYDEARALGCEIGLYCGACHRKVSIEIGAPRLAGKPFAGGPRFICQNFIKRRSASPGYTCGTVAGITIYPPLDKRVSPSEHGILYCSLVCGTCEPAWEISQARRDDPMWAPLNDKRFKGYRCPGCRRTIWPGWHGYDTRPSHLQAAEGRA